MKKSIFSILVALLLISISCTSQKKSSGDNIAVDYQIQSSYILLPIEEKSPEVKIQLRTPDSEDQSTFDVHLAVNRIDYWIPVDVKKWKGQKVTLSFLGVKKPFLGINEVKQSDKFEFDYNEKYRPQFHFSPEHGWMNDPNGMVYLDGEYHLFYQYNPYGTMWGNMHWGHAVSTDLTSWTYLPTAITPDSLGTIFSGSAVIDVNNTAGFGANAMVAIYTSAGKVQAQSIAYSTDKGRTFTKYANNPVLANTGIPDFRDPKVFWNEASNEWIMSLATKQTITFYGSSNLKEWTRLSEFGEGIGAHGGVWECPDLFPLVYNAKTKWVLLVSINPGGPNGGSATQYFIGDFDGKTFTADKLPYPVWLDYGRDNYAGVTFSNIPKADGRKIFMGWMSNWDYANNVPTNNFRSAMTVARELGLENNGTHLILTNKPVKELTNLRANVNEIKDQIVDKAISIDNILKTYKGQFELEMTFVPQNAKVFGFGLTNSKGEYINFTFDLEQNMLKVDRRNAGIKDFNDKFASESIAPITKKGTYTIRLLVDKASTELFINNGETVSTNIVFPSEEYQHITFFTPNQSWKAKNIKLYEIK